MKLYKSLVISLFTLCAFSAHGQEGALYPKPSSPDTKFEYRIVREVTHRGVVVTKVMKSPMLNYILPSGSPWLPMTATKSSAEFELRDRKGVGYKVDVYLKENFIDDIQRDSIQGYVNSLREEIEKDPKQKFILLNEEAKFKPKEATRSIVNLDGSRTEIPYPGLTVKPFGMPQALVEYKIQHLDSNDQIIKEVGYSESITEFEEFVLCVVLEAEFAQFEQTQKLFTDTIKKFSVANADWIRDVAY